ncbi:hypothetical protein HNR23_003907 [Nocardiopsis mwathae]|uniref:Uncharacterized protein n=1 Tax=Nocardiopsis mwathae TaxID=1472723 RepID=A0A7W9YKG9_9ACTN|nr:hypothetical protein [Nocardiopsis mwathae]MBB6173847.1 hypothetical protein [Nocardiopsis mwathae]
MTTWCEIKDVGDPARLRALADAMGAPVVQRGYTLDGRAILSATCPRCERLTVVAVTPAKSPQAPIVWRSPFE